MEKSDIPTGSEFGPNQVDLAAVLGLAHTHSGNAAAFAAAMKALKGWSDKTSQNTGLSLRSYGLVDGEFRLTRVGERLRSLAGDPPAMYADFARHILLQLNGLGVVNATDAVIRSGGTPTQVSISQYLKPLGLYASASGTHVSKMIGWLHKAGVFREDGKYETLDMARVQEILGTTEAELDLLGEMPEAQRCVMKALANWPAGPAPDATPINAAEVRDYAEALYGYPYDPKNFPQAVLSDLQEAGYIRYERPTAGRSVVLYRTEKFVKEYLAPLLDALADTGLAVRQLLSKPLAEILAELTSTDRNVKGKALEALAFYLTRLLGLEFRAWRKRSKETGGAEVDLIVEGVRLLFSRWQVQCKNTPDDAVPLEDVAKEVGLSLRLKSNVILMATTGRFSRDARQYAEEVVQTTSLNVVLLDARDLAELKENPLKIVPILNARARRATEVKQL
jgi:site-specific DNA-methyltransferase (cytosine-N4-specific)